MTKSKESSQPVTVDRRGAKERRKSNDRRKKDMPVAEERRQTERRKVPRRRQIDPTTCERDYRQDELDFMRAMDDYKCSSGRMFPTCSEVLEVIRSMGYVRLTAEQRELLGETLEPSTETYVDPSHTDDDFDCED